jgi:hypothetical protein
MAARSTGREQPEAAQLEPTQQRGGFAGTRPTPADPWIAGQAEGQSVPEPGGCVPAPADRRIKPVPAGCVPEPPDRRLGPAGLCIPLPARWPRSR